MKFSTLTINQQEVLEIIVAHIKINGQSPSVRDILKRHTRIKSLRGILIQLEALEEAGYIERSSSAKSITINESLWSSKDELIEVPLLSCNIQAGPSSFFEEMSSSTIPVMLSATKGLKKVYAFKVSGLSMIDAGIFEGDYAIVTPYAKAANGDIVAAMTDGGLTLKFFRMVDGYPMLFPANKSYMPIVQDFEVKGKLINVLKPKMVDYFVSLKKLARNFY